MGFSHKVYSIDSNNSIEETVAVIKSIRKEAIKNEKVTYYYGFKLVDVHQYRSIENSYPLNSHVEWLCFNLNDCPGRSISDLIALEKVYKRFSFYSHKPVDRLKNDDLGYSVDGELVKKEVRLIIKLPKKSTKAKLSRIDLVIKALNEEGIFLMSKQDIEKAFPYVLAKNKSGKLIKDRRWSSGSGWTIEGGSNFIRILFECRFIDHQKLSVGLLAKKCHDCLSKITTGTIGYKGMFYVTDVDYFLKAIIKKPKIKLSTNVYIDLNRMSDFQINDLLQLNLRQGDEEIIMNDFSWKWGNSNWNSLVLYINKDSHEFEIQIKLEEADEMVPRIEQVIGHRLIFRDWS